VLLQSGFPHAKEFFQKLFAVWVRALKNIRLPSPRPKSLKNIGFKGAKLLTCAWRPRVSARPCLRIDVTLYEYVESGQMELRLANNVFCAIDKWVPVTTSWRVLRLRMEERPPDVEELNSMEQSPS
jgi:hypothetical protein